MQFHWIGYRISCTDLKVRITVPNNLSIMWSRNEKFKEQNDNSICITDTSLKNYYSSSAI